MATETPVAKRPWVDGPACKVRTLHCNWCPYLPERPREYVGINFHWPRKDVFCADPSHDLLVRGLENDWTPPPDYRCPFGMTFDGVRTDLVELVVRRIADRKITAQQAIDSLTALGIDVDVEVAKA